MQALAERLGDALTGKVLEGVEPLGFSALKTVVPAPETLIGRPVERVDRRAKYLILDFGEVGRESCSTSRRPAASTSRTRPRRRGPRARWCVCASPTTPAVLVREYGHERKAAWWVLAPGDDGPLERLGPEPDSDEFAEMHPPRRRRTPCAHAAARPAHGRRASGAATPTTRCGARELSPYASLKSLDDDQRARLLEAVRGVMADGLERERGRTGGLSQPKLGEHFEVHAATARRARAAARRSGG